MNPWLGVLVVVLALAVSTGGGWVTTRLVLRLASRSSDAGGTSPRSASDSSRTSDATTDPATPEGAPCEGPDRPPTPVTGSDGPDGSAALAALRGGTWIGLLERFATTGALLYGEPTAIAVVVAIKGLGRYPELREHPAASERFVIGSLASLVWAAATGFVGRWLLVR